MINRAALAQFNSPLITLTPTLAHAIHPHAGTVSTSLPPAALATSGVACST